MLTSFWIKFSYLSLRQVYRVFSLIYSRHLTILGSCYCKKQIDVSFLCICPLIDDKFCHNIVKVYCRTTCLLLVVPQPLWQCYDTIYHPLEDRRMKNQRQFVNLTVRVSLELTEHICISFRIFWYPFRLIQKAYIWRHFNTCFRSNSFWWGNFLLSGKPRYSEIAENHSWLSWIWSTLYKKTENSTPFEVFKRK